MVHKILSIIISCS